VDKYKALWGEEGVIEVKQIGGGREEEGRSDR
jgi:hypothetical protein